MRFLSVSVLLVLLALVGYASAPVHAQSAQVWRPQPGASWQWQLTGKVDTSFVVDAYEIDGFDNGAAVVDRIHGRGAKAICYISAGSWENWRPDAEAFPDSVKGRSNGWSGEKWLDIRRREILRPIMARRQGSVR